MQKKLSKKQWWIAAAVFFLLIGGIVGYRLWQEPRDIGSQLEYIGDVNSGCSWEMGILTLGFCGYKETNHYYIFATDLSERELVAYFKDKPELKAESGDAGESVDIMFASGGIDVTTTYYLDAQKYLSTVRQGDDLAVSRMTTSKKHIFKVNKTIYQLVRASY